MTAPERIWINKVHGQHPDDWDFTDGEHLTKAQLRKKVKYTRADLHDATKAQLAKAVEALRKAREACLEAWGSHGAVSIDTVLAEIEEGKPK